MAAFETSIEYFIREEIKAYHIYGRLASMERKPAVKKLLLELQKEEWGHYQTLLHLSEKKDYAVPHLNIWLYVFLRWAFGFTFTIKLLELGEKKGIELYRAYANSTKGEAHREHILKIVESELHHENDLIEHIKEEKVEFLGSIVLGLNDGLIELTGALVGFSYAFADPRMVALTGLITGISASLSMSASAYMQAKQEPGKDPRKAAIYTGISYIVVVILLVFPFFLFTNVSIALLVMGGIILGIISAISYYTAVLFNRSFWKQLRQMLFFSIGVAAIAFLLGSWFRSLTGIAVQ